MSSVCTILVGKTQALAGDLFPGRRVVPPAEEPLTRLFPVGAPLLNWVGTCPKVSPREADEVDKWEWAKAPAQVKLMTIGSISAASLSQHVLAVSDSSQLQQALQTLQTSLTSGDLDSAQSAFQTVQNLNQSLEAANGSSASNSSQLSTDMTALGGALSSGDLSTAQSAFATVQSDLKSSASPSQTLETSAASQSEQLVQELLSTVSESSSSSSISDSTTSVLERVYGSPGSLNVFG
jgi:ribosomal protein S20